MGLLLLLPLLAAAATLILLRGRRLVEPLPEDFDPRTPLTPADRLRLDRWARRLRRAFLAVAASYLLLAGSSLLGFGAPPEREALALALLSLLCGLGVAIQFSERCPRCGYNLGFQTRFSLPEACERCGGLYH